MGFMLLVVFDLVNAFGLVGKVVVTVFSVVRMFECRGCVSWC